MLHGYAIGAVILMGGEGRRFGGLVPKQFRLLGDKKIYLHTLEAFLTSQIFDAIALVCHPDWIDEVKKEVPGVIVTPGGSTRQQSSLLGLQALSPKPYIVSIHDAVRPFIAREIIQANVEQAILHGAVDTCIPSTDTLVFSPGKKTIASIPLREQYLRGQTPQTFRYDWIAKAHEAAAREGVENCTDDCQLILKQGHPIHIVEGSEKNIKITTEFDLVIAEKFLENIQPLSTSKIS